MQKLLVGVTIAFAGFSSFAQRTQPDYGNQRSHDDRRRDDRGDDDDYENNRNDSYSYGEYRNSHDRGNHYGWRNQSQHSSKRYDRPRYVYYRDYDVYYDCRNNAYITHTGRRWVVSPQPPRAYRHVNWRAARGYEVDYWDDDFHQYLERRRPPIGRQYPGW